MKRKDRLREARNFAVYYGCERVKELASFDLVIIEPSAYTKASLQVIQATGALVLAYVSVMEINSDDHRIGLLRQCDFLTQGGVPVLNQQYENYLLNLESERWCNLLLHQIGQYLTQYGYDGVFLDTIGNIEQFIPHGDQQAAQLLAASVLLKHLRKLYPNHLVIQNNGLEKLCALTADYIDGICWENPCVGSQAADVWVNSMVDYLTVLQRQHGLKIMLLYEENELKQQAANRDFARTLNIAHDQQFLIYRAPAGYSGAIFGVR